MTTAPTSTTTPLFSFAAPRIGTFWAEQGGIYAGIVAGENGEPDYHLIHASSEHEIFEVDFASAIEAAKKRSMVLKTGIYPPAATHAYSLSIAVTAST